LHLIGLNQEKLTYRYAGRDFRLTDVYGNVVKEVLGISRNLQRHFRLDRVSPPSLLISHRLTA
jgi:hypothetical protein